jgi:hypothetical protein
VLVVWEQIYRKENKVKVLKRGKMKIKNKKEKEEKSKKRMKKMKRKKEVKTLFHFVPRLYSEKYGELFFGTSRNKKQAI